MSDTITTPGTIVTMPEPRIAVPDTDLVLPVNHIRALIDQMLGETLQLGLDPSATAANTPRNPKFASASKLWLKGKKCIVCGGTLKLEAHHKYPFHLFPQLEMDERYWRPLCEGDHRLNCHLLCGHGGNFEGFNPLVDELAGMLSFLLRTNHTLLAAIRQEIKNNLPPAPVTPTDAPATSA